MFQALFSRNTPAANRSISHIHLHTPLTGVVLSDIWGKLPIDVSHFHIKALDGFTFDNNLDRIYWDVADNYNESLTSIFIGSAGVEITAGLVSSATIFLGLFIDGNLILETPLTFAAIDKIQWYSANGILINSNDEDLLQSGSYSEFFAKSGTSETPTITLNSFNTIIKRG